MKSEKSENKKNYNRSITERTQNNGASGVSAQIHRNQQWPHQQLEPITAANRK